MFVVVPEDVVIARAQSASEHLFGHWLDGRDCLRIASEAGNTDAPVAIRVTEVEWRTSRGAAQERGAALGIILVCDAATRTASCFALESGEWVGVAVDVVRLEADYHKRQQGLFDVGYLHDRTVAVIGLGTGGGLIATQLARCGVGRFSLVDFDRLEVHNIARHVCTMDDLGRRKTAAVGDLLERIHPKVHVETFDMNVLEDGARLEEIVGGADLVVAATDSEASKSQINRICWRRGVPSVYGAAYDRGFGGDAFRCIPPREACYNCFQLQVADMFDSAPRFSEIDYASIKDPTRFFAEPGLGIDIGFLGLVASKLALLTLLHGTPSQLPDWPSNYVMWGNQPGWAFDAPLQALFVPVARLSNCSVCNPVGYVEAAIGEHLTRDEIDARARSLLDSAETISDP
jgi:molybdopterin/thiamine biosynthesis adenylyltransferase